MVAALRLYLKMTGRCLHYLPDRLGICRVCASPASHEDDALIGGLS